MGGKPLCGLIHGSQTNHCVFSTQCYLTCVSTRISLSLISWPLMDKSSLADGCLLFSLNNGLRWLITYTTMLLRTELTCLFGSGAKTQCSPRNRYMIAWLGKILGDTLITFGKPKIPYKIKIFMWLVENNAILTKNNLIWRHWVGDPICQFCTAHETIDHLFFQCPVAKVTWGIVAHCLGATDIPQPILQYRAWIRKWLPGG